MGKLFDELPSKEELQEWINTYAGYVNIPARREHRQASLEYLMRLWEPAKEEYLFKMLGNKFIVEKPYVIEKHFNEIKSEVDACLSYGDMETFYNNYITWCKHYINEKIMKDEYTANMHDLYDLCRATALSHNMYAGRNLKIKVNDKEIAIQYGCKPIRILNKIAQAAELEGFEAFRLAHSMILNQKQIKGKLCLSIHPLDYITMSDNEYDWDSCMNWRNNGCYRMGTVEMMNSPMVVVAYLTGNKTMRYYNHEWNSKKWRNLFIVDKDIIIGIKGYPYQNEDFDTACLEALKELAEKNLGWTYGSEIYHHSFDGDRREGIYLENEDEYLELTFRTNYMYNDFGNGNDTHFLLSNKREDNCIDLTYSGIPECMFCGGVVGIDVYINEADTVICESCVEYTTCEHCGNRIYGENYFDLDDHILCESCYYDHREYDPIDNDYHYDGDMYKLYYISKEYEESIKESLSIDSDEFYGQHKYIYVFSETDVSDLNVKEVTVKHNSWYGNYVDYEKCVFESNISNDKTTSSHIKGVFRREGNYD